MSYILDALRRAEADRERERGRVPGLHTPPASGSDAARAAGPSRWLPWVGGGVLLLAGIVAGSWLTSSPRDAVPPPPAPALPDVAPQPQVAMTPAPAALPSTPVPPPPATSASPYLPPLQPPAAVATAPAPKPAVVPTPAPEPEARLPKLTELPENLRRDVPKLAISGSVYSEDAASRFVIINGEVQKEGAKLGDDFVLEQIRPRELVLRFKGQRFRQPV
jgi:general secretion pathway protein B